ncbi:MAG: cysteine desulfurase [Gammaproteobacteria bacterium]|nr:cysteine desulfurase [Gammaproteobacteria bacterium]MDH4252986.1 cysteine desulfurase [Gammaproteobacteria bacterium]MDH5308592.1 cysteine desulfurase [Gammaproteobacteria bacterium]
MNAPDNSRIVYLDYAATTPIDAAVLEEMTGCLRESASYGNPSAIHIAGRRARWKIDAAREDLARLLGCSARCLVFTSGATEADNLAIIGAARFRAHRGRHIVTVSTEHKAVLEACAALAKEGWDVTRIDPDTDGLVSPEALADALRPDTQLVSIMHVNNETGVLQDIARLGRLCRERDVLFHVDAAQSVGKLPIDVGDWPVDLLSLTAHKFHGPQGVGALYIADRAGCGVVPLLHGGSQERRLRPGTPALALIAGLGAAARIASGRMASDLVHVRRLHDRLLGGLAGLEGIRRNGSVTSNYPGIVNISAAGVEGESLMLALEPVCVSSGSACNSQSGEPSFVLKALGRTDREAQAAIRFSFGRDTHADDVDFALRRYVAAVTRLRALAPGQAA